MADRIHLHRFALSIARRSKLLPVTWTGHTIATMPEIGCAGLISHARKHPALLPALDFPKGVAAELEIVCAAGQ